MCQHTGERPNRCSICGDSFIAVNRLKDHIRRRHPASEANVAVKALESKMRKRANASKTVSNDGSDSDGAKGTKKAKVEVITLSDDEVQQVKMKTEQDTVEVAILDDTPQVIPMTQPFLQPAAATNVPYMSVVTGTDGQMYLVPQQQMPGQFLDPNQQQHQPISTSPIFVPQATNIDPAKNVLCPPSTLSLQPGQTTSPNGMQTLILAPTHFNHFPATSQSPIIATSPYPQQQSYVTRPQSSGQMPLTSPSVVDESELRNIVDTISMPTPEPSDAPLLDLPDRVLNPGDNGDFRMGGDSASDLGKTNDATAVQLTGTVDFLTLAQAPTFDQPTTTSVSTSGQQKVAQSEGARKSNDTLCQAQREPATRGESGSFGWENIDLDQSARNMLTEVGKSTTDIVASALIASNVLEPASASSVTTGSGSDLSKTRAVEGPKVVTSVHARVANPASRVDTSASSSSENKSEFKCGQCERKYRYESFLKNHLAHCKGPKPR